MNKEKVEGRGEFEGCSPRLERGAVQRSPCLIAGKEVIGRRLVVERGEDWTQGAVVAFDASSSRHKVPFLRRLAAYNVVITYAPLQNIVATKQAGGAGAVCCARSARRGMARLGWFEILLADGAVTGHRGQPDILLRAHATALGGGEPAGAAMEP